MKKILLVAAVALASVVGANAQSFGVKGGYNYATLNGKKADKMDLTGLSGFYVGGLVELPLSDTFSIQPELIYSRQGAKFERDYSIFGASLGKQEATLTMDYINIPVFAKVNFPGGFSLQGGPQFGFLVGKPEVDAKAFGIAGTEKFNKDNFGTFDFAMGVGASYALENGLFFDVRYTHGLTNVFDKDNKDWESSKWGDDKDFKNSVISVGLGFKL